MKCKKCGTTTGNVTTKTLIGGYTVDLCNDCQNLWHNEIFYDEDFLRLHEMRVGELKTKKALLGLRDLENALFLKGKKWAEGKKGD